MIMLEELKRINYIGEKDELIFIIANVIGTNSILYRDIKIICSHTPGLRFSSVEDILKYCIIFGWLNVENNIISISSKLIGLIDDSEKLNDYLVESTISQLFNIGLLNINMFNYDALNGQYYLKNELFPLSLAYLRNMLVSQNFFHIERTNKIRKFYINEKFESIIRNLCKMQSHIHSLNELKKKLEENEKAGEKAELFVMEYEMKRLGSPHRDHIKRISEIDVSAGYDIVSYNSNESIMPDRYIEVKAISESGFYWSKNEYEVAKLLGEKYYLYLVKLSKTLDINYVPEIICNPAEAIWKSNNWLIEPQSYCINKLPTSNF